MKIVHIIPSLERGGAERLVINICYALQKIKGHDVQLISLSKENDYEELTVNLLDYKVIECKPFFSVFKKNFRQKKVFLVQKHYFYSPFWSISSFIWSMLTLFNEKKLRF